MIAEGLKGEVSTITFPARVSRNSLELVALTLGRVTSHEQLDQRFM